MSLAATGSTRSDSREGRVAVFVHAPWTHSVRQITLDRPFIDNTCSRKQRKCAVMRSVVCGQIKHCGSLVYPEAVDYGSVMGKLHVLDAGLHDLADLEMC